ncbi:MAG TPA: HPr family phosphocarrier protein [Anaerolineales bacterium]|nr:HPr family phosphocarrier protein [Anaerolineales bacterium]
MPSAEVAVMHPAGLHARPAAEFVKLAASFPCNIKVRNLTADNKLVNAKSILSVLTLGVQQGHRICIETSGEKEEEALRALMELIESNFGEAKP